MKEEASTNNYCVEAEETLTELVTAVNTMIAAGYRPIGGISVVNRLTREGSSDPVFCYYFQAMIKEES